MPKREDVRRVVHGLAAHLLGRHVADGAEHDAGSVPRVCGRAGLVDGRDRVRLRQLGQAEVEDLHAAVVGDEEVLGLEVAMDDAVVVRGGEAVGDLDGVVDGLAHRQRDRRSSRSRSVSPSSSS